MTLPMFFAESGTLDEVNQDSLIVVTGDEGRHAVTVKRIQVGEQVLIADGSGLVANCTVVETRGKDSLTVRADSWGPSDSRTDLIVVLALIKGERMERAVEQLTEVGVGTIVPWASERSVVTLKGDAATKIHKRLERKAFEAAKQCRQPSVPKVLLPISTAGLTEFLQLSEASKGRDILVLHEEATVDLSSDDTAARVLIVGPEGGLTPAEVENFEQLGSETRLMGRNVMRAGTAAVVGAAWCILHR
ncbi:MAG: RsmE family RNA methyltransferase [Candidatus Nanopelagicales bacterium]